MEIDFKIVMERKFKSKIDWLSSCYEKEIGGFIVGEVTEDSLILQDLLIPEQEVTSGDIELKPQQLVKLRKEYGDLCIKIVGHWHSHNSMGCMWSSTDDEMIEQFSNNRDITLFIVSSEGEHRLRLELKKPFKMSLDKLSYLIKDDELEEELKAEIEKKVTEITYTSSWEKWKERGILEEQTTLNDDFKEKINRMMKYYNQNNMVEISGLSPYAVEMLMDYYPNLMPTLISEDKYKFRLEFNLPSKKQAKRFMKEVREILGDLLDREKVNLIADCDTHLTEEDIDRLNKGSFLEY